jgi:pyruvate formate lyase activating enzyme
MERPNPSLVEWLDRNTREGELFERLPDQRVRCVACGHRCLIPPGQRGVCKVRFNDSGSLRVPFGYVAALAVDPIEKKPFFHALPGAQALSFGMLGCDLHCGYCQNWVSSQSLRDPRAVAGLEETSAEEILALAKQHRTPVITSTYNEPLITSEWAVAVFRKARDLGLLCAYVSNGNACPEVLDYLAPYVSLFKIDLKGFRDRHYRELGGTLEAVLRTIRAVHARGIWLEVVTLVVSGFNDSPEELRDIARFLVSVSPDIPWHVTAFHADYKMSEGQGTTARQLVAAAETGVKEGLNFVYAGNLPGATAGWEDTRCPGCHAVLLRRRGFRILENRLEGGRCPDCARTIPGRWSLPARTPAGV